MILDIGHCDTCEIASTCYKQIEENEEEASYILEAMESDAEIKLEKISYDKTEKTDRRGFLSADRKSTRLNSSHITISYAVFCLKKKKKKKQKKKQKKKRRRKKKQDTLKQQHHKHHQDRRETIQD